VELLAVVLGTGHRDASALEIAAMLHIRFPRLEELAAQSPNELAKCNGLGAAKAARLLASFELGRRLVRGEAVAHQEILTPPSAYAYLAPRLRDAREERFVVLLLDTRSRLTREVTVSVGSLNASIVHPREVFRQAVLHGAAALLLAHNHPSGDPTPSGEDVFFTRRMIEAGKLMGVDVVDHLILGTSRFLSMRQRGMI